MKLYCIAMACLSVLVSCGKRGMVAPALVPPDATWCDKFDAETIPKRKAPYVVEGVWLSESDGESEMTFFPNGATDDEQVHWRIENAKYLRIVGEEPQQFFTYRRSGSYCIVKTLSVDQFVMTVSDLNSEVTFIQKTPKNPAWALRPLSSEEIEEVRRRASTVAFPLTERRFLDVMPELDFNGKTESLEDGDTLRLIWRRWQERFQVRLRVQGEGEERRILEVVILGPFDKAHPPPPWVRALDDCPYEREETSAK